MTGCRRNPKRDCLFQLEQGLLSKEFQSHYWNSQLLVVFRVQAEKEHWLRKGLLWNWTVIGILKKPELENKRMAIVTN